MYAHVHTVKNHLMFSWKFLTPLYHCFCKYCLCEKCIRVMKFLAEALISSHFYKRGWIREYNLLLSHCSSPVLTIEILLLVFLRQTWPQPDMTLYFFSCVTTVLNQVLSKLHYPILVNFCVAISKVNTLKKNFWPVFVGLWIKYCTPASWHLHILPITKYLTTSCFPHS